MNKHNERAELIRELKELAEALPFEGGRYMDYAAELVTKAAALLEAQPAERAELKDAQIDEIAEQHATGQDDQDRYIVTTAELHEIIKDAAALLEAQPMTDDTERLDFVLSNAAVIVITVNDAGRKCFQLWSQDDNENFITLSGEGVFFPSERAAIDAARNTAHGIKERP